MSFFGRFLLFPAICCLSINVTNAQEARSTFVDAHEMSLLLVKNSSCDNCLKEDQKLRFQELLKSYAGTDNVSEIMERNPFLNEAKYFLNGTLSETEKGQWQAPVNEDRSETKGLWDDEVRGSAMNWQSSLVQGVANFVGERFKEDVTNYGLFQITSRLSRTEGMEVLFPKTCKFIKSLGEDTYYFADLNLLRVTAELDLRRIPQQLDKYLEVRDMEMSEGLREEISFIAQAFDFAKNSATPIEAVDKFYQGYKGVGKLKDGVGLVQLIAHAVSIPTPYGGSIWLSPAQLSLNNLNKDIRVRMFYGLLYEQLRVHPIFKGGENLDNFSQMFKTTLQNLEAFQTTHNSLASKSKMEFQDYKLYSIRLVELVKPFMSARAERMSDRILELVSVIESKEYLQIVPVMMEILLEAEDVVFQDKDRDFFRLLSFTVGLILAESPEDVKALIKTTALPVGSSSLKRSGKWDVSLNGYVGATGGAEMLRVGNEQATYLNTGLSAPVGFSFSKRLSKNRSRSISLFVSVFDVGSLLNQGAPDSIRSDLNLRIDQFVAPGIGLFYNVGRSPFTLGAHAFYVPSIREVSDKNSTTVITQGHLGVWRCNLSLLVDIPLLSIYHKPHQSSNAPKPKRAKS